MREAFTRIRSHAVDALNCTKSGHTSSMTSRCIQRVIDTIDVEMSLSGNSPILRKARIDALVDRFLAWPLPKGVCSDRCVTDPDYKFPRSGTNLLSADEARQMIDHLLSDLTFWGTDQDAADRVPERETFWLVERNVTPPQYISHNSAGWHRDVWMARRFKSERAAHDYWCLMGEIDRPQFKVVEHMFINKPESD